MKLRIEPESLRVLEAALQDAASNEIGGQIFGQQLAPSDFLVSEITVQRRMGSFARFVVDVAQAMLDAVRFFDRTRHRYTRFNYIGEWHSHPSFEVAPSTTDRDTMRALVGDSGFRGNFAVLVIARLDSTGLTCGGWIFDPDGGEHPLTIETTHD